MCTKSEPLFIFSSYDLKYIIFEGISSTHELAFSIYIKGHDLFHPYIFRIFRVFDKNGLHCLISHSSFLFLLLSCEPPPLKIA
jgi:hypothetical protein